MPTYIMLWKYTNQGVANIKDGPRRLDAGKQSARALGGEITGYYLTKGQYDGISVFEMPDDEAMAKLALSVGALGNITTETLRAFPEDEFRALIADLP